MAVHSCLVTVRFVPLRGSCLIEIHRIRRQDSISSTTMNGESRMDLTKTVPRSPKQKMLGLVSLARTIDKARAYNEGKLGEYDYDCPHDKPLFEFLGTDGATFAAKVKDLKTEEAIRSE